MNDKSLFYGDLDCPTDQEQFDKTVDAMRSRTTDDSDVDFIETLFKKYKELQEEIEQANRRIENLEQMI